MSYVAATSGVEVFTPSGLPGRHDCHDADSDQLRVRRPGPENALHHRQNDAQRDTDRGQRRPPSHRQHAVPGIPGRP